MRFKTVCLDVPSSMVPAGIAASNVVKRSPDTYACPSDPLVSNECVVKAVSPDGPLMLIFSTKLSNIQRGINGARKYTWVDLWVNTKGSTHAP